MKTVSGSIVSSKPISLPKAASILNAFVSAETGASNVISAFLRRASDSFNELVEFHNEAKGKRSKKKLKAISFGSLGLSNGNLADAADLKEEEQSVRYSEVVSEGGGYLYEEEGSGEMKKEKKKKKKKKKKKEKKGEIEGEEEEDEEEKSSERRKRKNKVKVEHGGAVDSVEKHEWKKKKKRKKMK